MDWLDEPYGDPYSPGDLVICQSCGYEVPDTEAERDFFGRCWDCVKAGKRTSWVPYNACFGCRRQIPDSGRVKHVCDECRPRLRRFKHTGQEVFILPAPLQKVKVTVRVPLE